MKFILNWIISALAIIITTFLINGFSAGSVVVVSLWSALIAALVLGIVNALLKPILHILALPITILTLGLFSFVINALMILLVAWLVPGFEIAGFWVALIFSIVLTLVSWVLHKII